MGIKGLFKLLQSDAPGSYNEKSKNVYKNKIIAIDASIAMYQFLVQIRLIQESSYSKQLMSKDGEVTSHLQGFFSRTINLLEHGIKPVYVFDGKPPEFKYEELSRRKEIKKKAEEMSCTAKELVDMATTEQELKDANDAIDKANKMNITVTSKQVEEVKYLLKLLGVPVFEAKSEAEAQCAEFVKTGKAYATSTEDMDALTFGSELLLRVSKEKITEINLQKILDELELSYEQFVDLCILCGCDYCGSIRGIGPKTALKLIRKHVTIEEIVKYLSKKYTVPENFIENLDTVRELFIAPEVFPGSAAEFVFGKVNTPGLIEFLCTEKNFNKERVMNIIEKLEKKTKLDKNQPMIESFFRKKHE